MRTSLPLAGVIGLAVLLVPACSRSPSPHFSGGGTSNHTVPGDGGAMDGGSTDTGTGDGGTTDTGTGDGGTADTGTGDGGTADTGTGDTGIPILGTGYDAGDTAYQLDVHRPERGDMVPSRPVRQAGPAHRGPYG